LSIPLAKLGDFLELHQRLLKFEVIDGFTEVIEYALIKPTLHLRDICLQRGRER
jgi:hypothetical protein